MMKKMKHSFQQKNASDNDENENMADPNVSRTRKKREVEALQQIGEQLTNLSPDQLRRINLPENLLSAVTQARQMSRHGAKRRQLQYIGKLMRAVDADLIQASLQNIQEGDRGKAALFQQIEHWRDELKAGNTEIIEEILESCPAAERQRLCQLSRNAINPKATSKHAQKAAKALFRYLREVCKT